MNNHSRHTPFRMCVVALFFVLAWWRVFMTNSLPAKIARKLQANRNFWKAAAILKPVGRELGLRGVMDFDRHFDQGLSTRSMKHKNEAKNPHWCESCDLVTFVSGRQNGWSSTLHFENIYILRRGPGGEELRIWNGCEVKKARFR